MEMALSNVSTTSASSLSDLLNSTFKMKTIRRRNNVCHKALFLDNIILDGHLRKDNVRNEDCLLVAVILRFLTSPCFENFHFRGGVNRDLNVQIVHHSCPCETEFICSTEISHQRKNKALQIAMATNFVHERMSHDLTENCRVAHRQTNK